MNDDANFIRALEGAMTPDLETAIDALFLAMPNATDDEIADLLRDRFAEVYAKNQRALFDLGLANLIEQAKQNQP